MAGRCGCSSAAATGAAVIASDCLTVSGAGTPVSPFLLGHGPTCLHVISCTSGTRPSGPSEGQEIWETDTNRLRVWDGTTWRLVSPEVPAQHNFNGLALAGHTLGSVTVLTASLTEEFASGDPTMYVVFATLVVAGTDGDTWDVFLELNGTVYDKDRIGIPTSGWATGKLMTFSAVFTVPVTATVVLTYVGGTGNYTTFNAPGETNQLRAQPFLYS